MFIEKNNVGRNCLGDTNFHKKFKVQNFRNSIQRKLILKGI